MSTRNDKAVLQAIFNPFQPIGECSFEEVQPDDSPVESTPQDNEAKQMEIQGIEAANASNLNEAIDFFNKAVVLAPNRASGYNNRAQALRLKGDVDGALQDLNTAIRLSSGQGHVASQAFCQRGLIYKLQNNNQAAMQDFERSAELGNHFAKSIVVQSNPYAALCNQMLRDMMNKVRHGDTAAEEAQPTN